MSSILYIIAITVWLLVDYCDYLDTFTLTGRQLHTKRNTKVADKKEKVKLIGFFFLFPLISSIFSIFLNNNIKNDIHLSIFELYKLNIKEELKSHIEYIVYKYKYYEHFLCKYVYNHRDINTHTHIHIQKLSKDTIKFKILLHHRKGTSCLLVVLDSTKEGI